MVELRRRRDVLDGPVPLEDGLDDLVDDILDDVRLFIADGALELVQVEDLVRRADPPRLGKVVADDEGLDLELVQTVDRVAKARRGQAAALELADELMDDLLLLRLLKPGLDLQDLLQDLGRRGADVGVEPGLDLFAEKVVEMALEIGAVIVLVVDEKPFKGVLLAELGRSSGPLS